MKTVNCFTSITVFGIVLASVTPAKAISITDFSNFHTNEDAFTENNDSELVVNTENQNRKGSAFDQTSININENTSFTAEFDFNVSINDPAELNNGDGADGFTFMLQNDSRGVDAIGENGGFLGYGSSTDGNEINNSLAIEFDTFDNETNPSAGWQK